MEEIDIKENYKTVELYSSISKAKNLGLSLDGMSLPKVEIDRMHVLHSAITEVRAARKSKGGKRG